VFKRKSKSDKPVKAAKAPKPKKDKKAKVKPEKPAKAAKKSLMPAAAIKKQPTDIYTVMLMIAMGAVLVGCVLLYLELSRFGSYPWWNAS
jgi:hypothetical protein